MNYNVDSNRIAAVVRAYANGIIDQRYSYHKAPPHVETWIQHSAERGMELAKRMVATDKRYSQP